MVSRLQKALGDALWGFLAVALSAEEKSRLGVRRYDASDEWRESPRYDWEDAWLARALPPPPAHVLVGAAGAGREVASLLSCGYAVTALEPSRALAGLCRARSAAAGVVIGRYEDLVGGAACLRDRLGEDARPLVDAWTGERPFDAVLMGLGSVSHLLDGGPRAAVMSALAAMCPRGPILASAVALPRERAARSQEGAPSEQTPRFVGGRGARVGRAVARPIRAARGLAALDGSEVVFGGLGFVKLLTRGELRAIGEGIRRETVFEEQRPDGMELCVWPSGRSTRGW